MFQKAIFTDFISYAKYEQVILSFADSLAGQWIFCDVEFKKFTTKTCLYNFNPLKPHFYIVKLGFTGV